MGFQPLPYQVPQRGKINGQIALVILRSDTNGYIGPLVAIAIGIVEMLVVDHHRQNFPSGALGANSHVRPKPGYLGRLSVAKGQGKGREWVPK